MKIVPIFYANEFSNCLKKGDPTKKGVGGVLRGVWVQSLVFGQVRLNLLQIIQNFP